MLVNAKPVDALSFVAHSDKAVSEGRRVALRLKSVISRQQFEIVIQASIGSRIIGLIEAYEVMTSGKGYRAPQGFRQVLEELQSEAGAQFDPKVVAAFQELMTRRGERG